MQNKFETVAAPKSKTPVSMSILRHEAKFQDSARAYFFTGLSNYDR